MTRLEGRLAAAPDADSGDGARPAIETRGLTKRFRRVTALSECSITVPTGRICALVGPGRDRLPGPADPALRAAVGRRSPHRRGAPEPTVGWRGRAVAAARPAGAARAAGRHAVGRAASSGGAHAGARQAAPGAAARRAGRRARPAGPAAVPGHADLGRGGRGGQPHGAAVLACGRSATWAPTPSQWHAALGACTADRSCSSLANSLSLGNHGVYDLTIFSLIVPGVIGLLIGAPLVAGEVETGTSSFAWTQSISRGRWLLAKAGWLLLAAAVWGGCVAALVTWWSGPRNALYGNALQPNDFDMQGIVPVAYSLFGMALGIAAGALLRRTLPAIAVTLAGFIGVRTVVAEILRLHYLSAVTAYYSVVSNWTQPAGAWVLGSGVVDKSGQVLAVPDIVVDHGGVPNVIQGVPVSDLPAACRALIAAAAGTVSRATPNGHGAPMARIGSCIASAGFRQFVRYQPISRYWAFQGIETAIFVALAAALVALGFAAVRRRDA